MDAKVISIEVLLAVTDNEILVEDNSSMKSVVGTYEGFVTMCIANSDGKQNYILGKKFAKKLGEALLEKSK